MAVADSFLTPDELRQCGFAAVGANVLLSRFARIYTPEEIRLGSHVRIDDFCVLSAGIGGITIGDYVHIGCASLLYGGGKIVIGSYSTLSSRCAVYSQSDDFSGEATPSPMLPGRNVTLAPVVLEEHVLVGTNSTLLPGVTLATGCAVGAHSLVNRSCKEWTLYYGSPARAMKPRSKFLLREIGKIGVHDPES